MMSDKSCSKGLKNFEVDRGYTKRPPILYIPVEDDVAVAVVKALSGALKYKLELPGGTKVQTPFGKTEALRHSLNM